MLLFRIKTKEMVSMFHCAPKCLKASNLMNILLSVNKLMNEHLTQNVSLSKVLKSSALEEMFIHSPLRFPKCACAILTWSFNMTIIFIMETQKSLVLFYYRDMPSSYQGKWGRITYSLRARLTQSLWVVHKTKTEFPFVTKSEFPFASKSEMMIIGLKVCNWFYIIFWLTFLTNCLGTYCHLQFWLPEFVIGATMCNQDIISWPWEGHYECYLGENGSETR